MDNGTLVMIQDSLTARAAHVSPRRWNGWVCPYFTLDEGLSIVEQFSRLAVDYPDIGTLEWDEARGVFVHIYDYGPEYIEPSVIDGQTLYGIGAYGWCWELAKPQ